MECGCYFVLYDDMESPAWEHEHESDVIAELNGFSREEADRILEALEIRLGMHYGNLLRLEEDDGSPQALVYHAEAERVAKQATSTDGPDEYGLTSSALRMAERIRSQRDKTGQTTTDATDGQQEAERIRNRGDKDETSNKERPTSQDSADEDDANITSSTNPGSNGDPAIFEVYDADAGKTVFFNQTDTQRWGPVDYGEDWNWHEDIWTYACESTLYRHNSGHWTLISDRQHWEAPFSCGPEARRVSDSEAAKWLLRYDFELPEDVSHLAGKVFFAPGMPLPEEACQTEEGWPVRTDDPTPPSELPMQQTEDGQELDHSVEQPPPENRTPPANRIKPQPRLQVDVDQKTVTLDGTPHKVSHEQALWLDALVKANGDWRSSTELNVTKPDRLKARLPKEIQKMIESTTGKGSRIRREKL